MAEALAAGVARLNPRKFQDPWVTANGDRRAQVALRLTDANVPGNAGRYTLAVSGGLGTLIRDGTGRTATSPASSPVTLGPRGFAALYGGLPMATLRAAGLAAGGDRDTDAALDSVFGAQSFLLDYF